MSLLPLPEARRRGQSGPMMDTRLQPDTAGLAGSAAPAEVHVPAGHSGSSLAVASIIVALALAAIGNGLMFAYIPVKLGAEGFAPTWAGSILTGLSAGGIAGCLLTGPLVRRVGHARTYMILSALIVVSNVAVGAGTFPLLWVAARALYGFAICAMFIVVQSC